MLGAVLILQDAGPADHANVKRATAALEGVCERVLVFGGASEPDTDHRPLPADPSELAAVAAALREAGDGHVAVLPVDLGHPSAELLRYMAHVRGSFEAVVPERRDGTAQPLVALYHASLLRRADGLLAAGERDLSKLLHLASVRRISVDETAKFGEPEGLLERTGPTRL